MPKILSYISEALKPAVHGRDFAPPTDRLPLINKGTVATSPAKLTDRAPEILNLIAGSGKAIQKTDVKGPKAINPSEKNYPQIAGKNKRI